MKKTAAILLLLVMLFNWFGYRLFTLCLEKKAGSLLEVQLDNNDYDASELVTFRMALNLPYYTNSPEYERVNGEISVEGTLYNYVKRRIYNDSLEFVCIPSKEKIRLHKAGNEFFKLVNSLRHPEENGKTGNQAPGGKHLQLEFCEGMPVWIFGFNPDAVTEMCSFNTCMLPGAVPSPMHQPPERLS